MRFLAKREVEITDEDIFISKVAIQKHFGISSYLVAQLIAQGTLSEPTLLARSNDSGSKLACCHSRFISRRMDFSLADSVSSSAITGF